MTVRTLPGLGLRGFWDLGSSDWKPGMDSNLLLLSVITGQRVASITTTPPATPTSFVYIVPSDDVTNPNELAVWDGEAGAEAWVYFTPQAGWTFFVEDEGIEYQFDGASWGAVGSGSGSGMVQTGIATAHTVDDSDLAGNVIRRVGPADAQAITVPPSLVGTEPATFIRVGAGEVSFVAGAGVTLLSADGNLTLRVRYSSATLIPHADTPDTYYLVGDLAT